MGDTRRIPDDVRQAIVADARRTIGTDRGSTREIAARHGVSQASVRRIVAAADDVPQFGSEETRAKMQNAIEANKLDMAARRARLAEAFIREAERAIADMNSNEWKVYNFGGKDNTFAAVKLDYVPVADRRNLMIIAGTAVDKHKVLDQYDADARDADAVTAWIRDLSGRGKSDE